VGEPERNSFEPRPDSGELPANGAGWLLAQAVRLMHPPGETGAREYAHVIRLLRKDVRETTEAAARALDAAAAGPMARWSVLYVLNDVEDAQCIELLRTHAMRRVQERVREPGVCEQPADLEELVSVMAIDGLGRLAEDGNNEAVEALLAVVREQDRRSLRQPAVAALLRTQPDLRKRIEELLPDEDAHVLDLREATEADFMIEVTEEDLARKETRRRESRPKVPPAQRGVEAPSIRIDERR
jgi:hypothetical protein